MGPLRTLLLFDDTAQPLSWNERMTAGEYAVHYSSAPGTPPSAAEFTIIKGFAGEPIREFSGHGYKGESSLGPRFRRWVGSALSFGGLARG